MSFSVLIDSSLKTKSEETSLGPHSECIYLIIIVSLLKFS